MDIRIVETLPTSGLLADSRYRIDPNVEHISLKYSYGDESLALMDYNLDYSQLPYALGNGLVKKVFLTYNGISHQTKELLETVVMESANTSDTDQAPGFINSNEWIYYPGNFSIPVEAQDLGSVDLHFEWPYPFSQGVTLVKQFLNSEGNVDPNLYQAYYRRPTMTSFELANVEGNDVYTDGWYTSYTIAVKTYALVDPTTNGITEGQIVYNETDGLFYINITGDTLPYNVDESHLPENDTLNWAATPSFEQWMTLLRLNIGGSVITNTGNGGNVNNGTIAVNTSMPNGVQRFGNRRAAPSDPVFFIECQHLATPTLNAAILKELQRTCGCCHKDEFGLTHLEDWVRLTQKRMGAYVNFDKEQFKDAQCIIQSSRAKCNLCLYHKNCTSC